MKTPSLTIAGRKIGWGNPAFVIAELSANHNQSIEEACRLIALAKECNADAVKIQTYTPDTMTIDCQNEFFQIGKGTIWEGKNLYQLYQEACTPWEWHSEMFSYARKIGIPIFSTPFDESAVDLLESLDAPAYKIASFELVHLPLIRRVARTGKPIILSTGMGSLGEIVEAVDTARQAGCKELALLKCTSAYPAPPEEANLSRISHMEETFHVPAGLSDHTLGSAVAVASVCQGARIIEKHFTKSRYILGPDSSFSMEPQEFRSMINDIKTAEAAIGSVDYSLTKKEKSSHVFRRSLFVVKDIKQGDRITEEHIRIIRPGYGLHPRYWDVVIGKKVSRDIARGNPLEWSCLE